MSTKGRIHSFESFGTLEGPGIRYVVFLQGCPARCLYCQNPDTWKTTEGKVLPAEEVFERIEKCIPYMRSSGGGVTISGGEPLLQMDFLTELFRLCKRQEIHTAIDTSGFISTPAREQMKDLLPLTDLFLVDLKSTDAALHKRLTKRPLSQVLAFLELLEKNQKPYWIRYVLVPGITDKRKDLLNLRGLLTTLAHCERLEFLPYHTLGLHKWQLLGLKYPLEKTPAATGKDMAKAEALLK